MQIIRIVCLAVMVFGWIWNRKQWGFRGLIDGEGLIFTGFGGLLIIHPRSEVLICLLVTAVIAIGQGFRVKHWPKDNPLGAITVVSGILALTFSGIGFFVALPFGFVCLVLIDYILSQITRWMEKRSVRDLQNSSRR